MKHRITKTLLNSWRYLFDCAEGCEDDARQEFITTLSRVPTPPNEAQQAGLDFEALVFRMANGEAVDPGTRNYEGAKQIADIVRGGQWQLHVSTDLTVDGREFWLHGFCDVVKAGVIYDVKFKTSSMGSMDLINSYLHSSQHSAYLRCLPEAYQFIYLVSDGDALYTEAYDRKNSRPIESIIREFMDWMKTEPELLRMYDERWIAE